MSRGKNPRSKLLTSSRKAPKPLGEIIYPKENADAQTYETTAGHKIIVKVKRNSVTVGLAIFDREFGEVEIRKELLGFFNYAVCITEDDYAPLEAYLADDDGGRALVITRASGGIKVRIEFNDKGVASTVIPISSWRRILEDIQDKASKFSR